MKSSESALNWTGAIVIVTVTALSIGQMLRDTDQWLVLHSSVALLGCLHLILYLIYLSCPSTSDWQSRLLFWLQAISIATLYALVDVAYIAILGIVWTVQAIERLQLRPAIAAVALVVVLFAASHLLHADGEIATALSNIATLGLFHVFAMVATCRFWREQQLRQQSAALNRELLATRELLSQQSRQHERLRISRELHDLLGHQLTAMILQLELASHHDAEKSKQCVHEALVSARQLINDLRTAVSELRESDELDLQAAVQKLIEGIPDLAVELDFTEAPVVNEAHIAQALLRCIQEALTNVLRHSNGDHCRIALSKLYNHYFLSVDDNGTDSRRVNAGNGLRGMQERVMELGGDIEWTNRDEGFSLQVKLPVQASA